MKINVLLILLKRITNSKLSPSIICTNVSYATVVKNNSRITPSVPKPVEAQPDSGATGHFFNNDCPEKTLKHEPINVICANEPEMMSTQTKELNIAGLPQEAITAHVFPDMTRNLLSVPKLCDADCKCTFSKEKVEIIKENKTILQGPRDRTTNLWTVQIEHPQRVPEMANSAYQQRTKSELQAYLHACLCAPTTATLINAIKKGWLSTFPGLTVEGVRKHLPKSIQTTMGHLHRYRQGVRSTKKKQLKN